MLSKDRFIDLMIQAVEKEFPASADAFAEQIEVAATDFYAGKTDMHLKTPTDDARADFQFGDAVGLMATVVSSLTLVKVSVEIYLVLKKVYSKEDSDMDTPNVDKAQLKASLSERLRAHLPDEKAYSLAEEILSIL